MDSVDKGYEEGRFHKSCTPIDELLHCSLCANVLKDPVQCRQNEDHFCRTCVTRHLEANNSKCPQCQEDLTVETLTRPSKHITAMLSRLLISCDNALGGCEEFVQLEKLQEHVASCPIRLTTCTNHGCSTVLNRQDLEHHTNQVCGFRRWKCEDCSQEILSKDWNEHGCVMKKEIDLLKKRISVQEDFMKETRNLMAKMKCAIKNATDLPREDFLVVGWSQHNDFCEMYCSSTGNWIPLPPLTQRRVGASSFVYNDEVFVCGGHNGSAIVSTIESLNFKSKEQWLQFEGQLPYKCLGQTSTVYKDRFITVGGCVQHANERKFSNSIYETLLSPPYTSNLVHSLPEARCDHGAVLLNDDLIIVGGQSNSLDTGDPDSILRYNINKKDSKVIDKLPYPVSLMAVVSYGSKLIVIGGMVKGKASNTVMMLDIVTGQWKRLPDMNQRRASCSAIISGNVLVVMGGNVESYEKSGLTYGRDKSFTTTRSLKSVEYFNLGLSQRWKQLPDMSICTDRATTAVIPSFLL